MIIKHRHEIYTIVLSVISKEKLKAYHRNLWMCTKNLHGNSLFEIILLSNEIIFHEIIFHCATMPFNNGKFYKPSVQI